jgi:lysophospholipase L1-like esterase
MSCSSPNGSPFCSIRSLVLALAFAVACSSEGADDDSPEPTGGTSSLAGQGGKGGNGATGGQAGASGSGGKSGSGGGASGSAAGGKGQGGSGPAGAGAGSGESGSGGAAGGGASGTGGDGMDAGNGGSSAGASGAGAAGSSGSGSSTPEIHWVGRVDASDPNSVKFAWSGTGAVVRFDGTSAAVELAGGQEYTVVVDGQVGEKLTATNGMNVLAEGLPDGEHTVELYRRTEASLGESQILGFDFGDGALLPPPAVTRRLEFIGDSITCGYGNEGPDMNCGFTPETENHYLAYAALAARSVGAELSTVAWSGKGVVCNYGDDSNSCQDPLPTFYDRILPDRADSQWDFARFQPDAVVVNLGTNDLSTESDPDQATFEGAYRDFLEHLREKYPNAHILCTNGPMLTDDDLDKVRLYIENVVAALADPKISSFEIVPQDGSDGYGCDWHPSLERHEKVAAVVTAALRSALGW